MRRRQPIVLALAAFLAAGALAGCGAGSNSATPGGSVPADQSSAAGPPSSLPPNRTPLPSMFPVSPSAAPPKSAAAETTLTGTVEDGVEPGCVILRGDDNKSWQLVGGDQSVLRSGKKVVVRGRANPSLLSHCMQGTIFEVTEARIG